MTDLTEIPEAEFRAEADRRRRVAVAELERQNAERHRRVREEAEHRLTSELAEVVGHSLAPVQVDAIICAVRNYDEAIS